MGTDIVFYCPPMFEYCFLLRKRNAWRFVRVQLSIYLFPQLRDLIYLGEVNHWLRSTKLGNESPERMKNSICAGDIWLVSFSVFSRISSCPGWSTERAWTEETLRSKWKQNAFLSCSWCQLRHKDITILTSIVNGCQVCVQFVFGLNIF